MSILRSNQSLLLAIQAAIAFQVTAPHVLAEPLFELDQGGLAGMLHLPDSAEGSDFLPPGTTAFSLSMMTSSHSVVAAEKEESLVLDGETTHAAFSYRFRRHSQLEFGIDVPYVWHSSGMLDGFINSWHDFFSLPEGYRAARSNDQLQISYRDAVGQRIDLRDGTSGFGDVRVFAGWRVGDDAKSITSLRFGVKIPTGDALALRGSGGTDINVGIAKDTGELWGRPRLNGMLRANAVFIGKPDILPDRYRKFVVGIAAGMGYMASDILEFRVQTSFRSALYDSDIEMLGEPSLSLTVGGNLALSPGLELSISVAEDLKAESAPDVAFQLALRYRPE